MLAGEPVRAKGVVLLQREPEISMADEGSGGATPWLAFLVGGLVVAVAVLGYFFFINGHGSGGPDKLSVDVHVPSTPAKH